MPELMRCLIIEDEKPAQRVLQQFVSHCPDLELIKTCKSAMEAQGTLLSGNVDLLFLDINLPLVSGISLLKGLKNPPLVIITTAYSEYALEGYNLDVADYLLKPIAFERFLQSVNKAIRLFKSPKPITINKAERSTESQVVINVDKVLHQLSSKNILFISSDRDYVCFYTATRKYVFIDSLKKWEIDMQKYGFQRIHKSHIVNLDHIEKIEGKRVFITSHQLPIGRSYRSKFIEAFTN